MKYMNKNIYEYKIGTARARIIRSANKIDLMKLKQEQ